MLAPSSRAIPQLTLCVAMLLLITGSTAKSGNQELPADPLVEVDLELVLAVDTSLSMTPVELALQQNGYVMAFRDEQLMMAVNSGSNHKIAVTYVEWGGPRSQMVVVPWTIISTSGDAMNFADRLSAHTLIRPYTWDMGTSISESLRFAQGLFGRGGVRSIRRVIDISGDGPNNTGDEVEPVRDEIVAQGTTINGLPLTLHNEAKLYITASPYPDLQLYYDNCVIGGASAFAIGIDDIAQIDSAIRHKLTSEIVASVPKLQPASVTKKLKTPVVCSNTGK